MGQNLDVFPGSNKFLAMPNTWTWLYSVSKDYTPLGMVFNSLQKSKHFPTLLSINFKNLYEVWKDNTHAHIPKTKHLFFCPN